jgi:hypothetical protein
VQIEIELMEVLFFNLSLELTLVMKISEAHESSQAQTGVTSPAQPFDFASSSPSAQTCLGLLF